MHADEYEDALRYVTGSGYGSADVFRSGTHSNEWSDVRGGMRRMIQQLLQDASAVPVLADKRVQDDIRVFGLNRAIAALGDADATEAERAYRVACGLAHALKSVLNRVQASSGSAEPGAAADGGA
jgi:hypothetical protein